MAYNKITCPVCLSEKDCIQTVEIESLQQIVMLLKCGHSVIQQKLVLRSDKADQIVSENGDKCYPYQLEGIKFGEEAQLRFLCADDMGLGKSVQAACLVKLFWDVCKPTLIVCKDKLKIQWARYMFDWSGLLSQIVRGSKTVIKPSARVVIVSYETAALMQDKLEAFKFQCIIIDECQQIKNQTAARTKAVRTLCKTIPRIIATSGTPIKNSAPEYFSILNILRPNIFYNYNSFLANHCDYYTTSSGAIKYTGLKYPEEFRKKTKDFIIRRERHEVLPDLPKTTRTYRYAELSKQVNEAYEETLEQFTDAYSDGTKMDLKKYSNLLSYIARMRKLTGLAKVLPAADYLQDFLEQTDRKIVVFTHHISVADNLIRAMKGKHETVLEAAMADDDDEGDTKEDARETPVLHMPAKVKDEKRDNMIRDFQQDPTKRILVASTLSGAEGTDGLQLAASDLLFLERQWNPANEEQAEARLERIGQLQDKITAIYMVAVGTIDEYFAELVERKRQYVRQTLGSNEVMKWDETGLMKELMEVLAQKGLKKWNMKMAHQASTAALN